LTEHSEGVSEGLKTFSLLYFLASEILRHLLKILL